MKRLLPPLLLAAAALAGGPGGCSVQRTVASGQLDGVLRGSSALDTFHDFEASRRATYYLIGRVEGWHRVHPDDPIGPLLLARYWSFAVDAFIADDYELAHAAGNQAERDYHAGRMRDGFTRAQRYATTWLELRDAQFQHARESRATMKAYLTSEFKSRDDGVELADAARAFFGRARTDSARLGASRDNAKETAGLSIAEVGVLLAERAIELSHKGAFGRAHLELGRHWARNQELSRARTHFEQAERATQGQFLPALQYFATEYHCRTTDAAPYTQLLERIAQAEDPIPLARADNGVAKRRAVRYLKDKSWQADCLFNQAQ